MLVRTHYGWGIVEAGPMECSGIRGVKIRLTDNSRAPGQTILFYNVKGIVEYENPDDEKMINPAEGRN